MPYFLVLITLAGLVTAQLLLRKGMLLVGQFPHNVAEMIPFFFRAFTNFYVLFAILSAVLAGLAWVTAVSRAEHLSRIYPLIGLSYVGVALFSALIFKENVTILRWVGIITICVGAFLVSKS